MSNIAGKADVTSGDALCLRTAVKLKQYWTHTHTQSKFFIRSSDALGDINIPMEFRSLTPEIKVTDTQANLLGHVDITRSYVSVSQRVKMDNPDSNGQLLMSINNAKF